MLTGLSIRDVVLIEALDLSFGTGLGVLTGETGAGKSILLDALGLALGARADTGLVRQGAAQASVTASFDPPPAAAALLAESGLDVEPGEALIVRRTVKADGGSRAFVNDQPVSAACCASWVGRWSRFMASMTIAACSMRAAIGGCSMLSGGWIRRAWRRRTGSGARRPRPWPMPARSWRMPRGTGSGWSTPSPS